MSDVMEAKDHVKILQSGQNPAGINGFSDNVRSMFVAAFTMLLLYILLLLAKYIVNALIRRGPRISKGVTGTTQGSPYSMFRKMKGMGGTMPPPPPPMAQSAQMQQPGVEQGAMGGLEREDYMGDWKNGINSEVGTLRDTRASQAISRAADVTKLGFIMLLGGATLNGLSFDANASGNALIWIAFGLFGIWALWTLFSRSRWVPLVMGFLTFPIVIAVYSVGFETGSSSGFYS